MILLAAPIESRGCRGLAGESASAQACAGESVDDPLLAAPVAVIAVGDRPRAGTHACRTAPRSARRAPASRVRALRGSARGRPAEGGRRSPRSCRAPASRAARTTRLELLGRVGEAGEDRRHADADVDARVGERADRAQTARRRRGPGSVVRQTRSSSVGRETYTLTGTSRAAAARTSRSRTTSGPRVTIENGVPDDASSPMHARVSRNRPSAGWYGSVAVPSATSSRCHERSGELAAEHLGDVRLDADRAAVAVVRRTVGALLEVPDVTERAAVRAAHVRVERPPERHAADLRERRLARLDPVLDPHQTRIEHMFDRASVEGR